MKRIIQSAGAMKATILVMKSINRILLTAFLAIFLLVAYESKAQCTGGADGGALATPTAIYQTTTYATAGLYKTFTAVQGTPYNFTFCSNGGSASYDTQITILDNTGVYAGGFNDDFCGFQSNLTWQATGNAIFRVLVTNFPCSPSGGSSAILAYATIPLPTNDACSGAIAVAIPSTTAGSTATATTDIAPSCGSAVDATGGGVWYTVTGNGQKITASLCIGTSFDTQIRVFSGACGSLVCVAGNDDNVSCSPFTRSSVSWCSAPATVYRILVHGFGSATGTFSLDISGQNVAQPGITPSAPTFCTGGSTPLTASGLNDYTWSPGTGLSATNIASVTANPTVTTIYTVSGTETITSCLSSNTVTVTVNPTPAIPAQTATICSGGTFTITPVNGVPTGATIVPGGTTYTWTTPVVTGGITGGSGQATQPSISQTLTNPTITPQTATYTVTPTSGAACVGSAFTATVTVNPKPVIPAQTATLCSGGTFIITPANGVPTAATIVPAGTVYTCNAPVVTGGITGGGALSSQPSISQILTNPTNTPQTAIYTVLPISGAAGGCVGSAFTVTVTVNPRPVIPSQPATICSPATFTVSPANSVPTGATIVPGGTTYTWTTPVVTGGITGGSGQSAQPSISQTLTNPTNTLQTATYAVTPTSGAAGACVGSNFTVTVTVNSIPAQPGTISGNATICSASSNTYSISAVSGANSYTWTLPSGWTGTSPANSITPTASTTSGNISVTADNSCGSSIAQMVAVTVNPSPATPVTITGTTSICSGSSNTYSIATVSGATSYTWTLPSGWTGTSTTISITTTASATSGNIFVTANNSLCSSPLRSISVSVANSIPAQPGTIVGSATICLNVASQATYIIGAVSGATSYTWTLPSGWTGSSTTTSILTNPAFPGGNVSVTANNGCGSTARTLAVAVNSIPFLPGLISGNAACSGISNTYSVGAVINATSYNWTLPGGWSGTSTTTSITTTPSLTNGNISAQAVNFCGTSNVLTKAVTVSTLPFAVIQFAAGAICEGQNTAFTITAVGTSLTYQWQEDKGQGFVNVVNGGIYSGATTAALILTGITAVMNSYKYQCIVTNSCGVETSSSATLTVAAPPAKPTITVNATNPEAPVLTSSAGTIYQWFKNGIPAGGSQTLVVTGPGVYTVKVTINGCASVLSDPQSMIVTGDLERGHASSWMNVYPNPGSDLVILSLGGFEKDKPVSVSIIDMQGRVMEKITGLGQHEVSIDVRNYAGGKYIAWAQQYSVKVSRPFIKTDK